jgi:hypothetical protein
MCYRPHRTHPSISRAQGAAERTVFLVKFDAEVMSREKKLG